MSSRIKPVSLRRYTRAAIARIKMVVVALRSRWDSTRPFGDARPGVESCVIGNGIPKCGTYLLNELLGALDRWTRLPVHMLSSAWEFLPPDGGESELHLTPAPLAFRKLRNGHVVAAHIPWNPEVERALSRNDRSRRLRHVLMIRDPRDSMVSYLRFVAHSDKNPRDAFGRELKTFMLNEFDNDDDRMAWVIEQRKDEFRRYLPWLDSRVCHVVRFEELYTAMCRLEDGYWEDALLRLMDYLEIDVGKVDGPALARKVLHRGMTASGVKSKVGQFRNHFKERHYEMLNTPAFREDLERLGYSW